MTIRPGSKNDLYNISKLLVDIWRSCYSSFIPHTFLDNLKVEDQLRRHTQYWNSGITYLIAENDQEELLGFASFGKNRNQHISCPKELYTMYVNTNVQRIGVGKILVNEVLSLLKDDIAVTVFKDNPFKSFYPKCGFVKLREELIDMGEFKLASEIYLYSSDKN